MAHSSLKNRFAESLCCSHRLAAARAHLYQDLNNTYKSIFKSVVIPASRQLVRLNLSIARLPLYTIRKLPFCLPGVRPVEFYYQQWQDDVQHLLRTRHKLQYSMCRYPDALILSWEYGIKAMAGIKQRNECGDHCQCLTDTSKSIRNDD